MTTAIRFTALALALSFGAATPALSAQNGVDGGDLAQQLHSSISAQGNNALRQLQQENRDRIDNIPADFLPPAIWGLNPPSTDEAKKS